MNLSKVQQKQNDYFKLASASHTLTAIESLCIVIGSCLPYKYSLNVYCMIFTVYEQGKRDSTKFEYGNYLYCLKCNKKNWQINLAFGPSFHPYISLSTLNIVICKVNF